MRGYLLAAALFWLVLCSVATAAGSNQAGSSGQGSFDPPWAAILSSLSGLAGVVLGFMLTWVKERSLEKRLTAKEFSAIRAFITRTNIINNIPPRLNELRAFFLRHADLLDLTPVRAFFDKWLEDSAVEDGHAALDLSWNMSRITELRNELNALRL